MPYEAHFVDSGLGVHKHGIGVVTSAEIITDALNDAHHEDRARRLRYALVDLTGTTELRVTPSSLPQILEVVRKSASFSPGLLVAIVATNPFTFAMSRMWQSLAEGLHLNTSVFETRAEAVAWLKGKLLAEGGLENYPSLKG